MASITSPADLLAVLKAWFWEQDGFANEVFVFAEHNSAFFEAAQVYFDSGGQEHPLNWTLFHQQFVAQFEGRLLAFLASHGWDLNGLREALASVELAEDAEADVMLDIMLSMTDYEPWLKSMLALERKRAVDVAEAATEGPTSSGLHGAEVVEKESAPACDDCEAFM
mmetsp:Transcript_90535/g.156556  ORF Transcript_90535/g.156556 Transcript_90535/m.156556 type:complete len:167 (-) Transcript_90535:2-502(-)